MTCGSAAPTRRITWRTKARDGSSVVVISEPMENGTASLVVQQMGLETLELDEEARERWTSVVSRFLERVQPVRTTHQQLCCLGSHASSNTVDHWCNYTGWRTSFRPDGEDAAA